MTLRQILKEKGLTNKVVTDALGVHPNNIGRYDDLSKRSIEELKIISNAIDIDISELLGITINYIENKENHIEELPIENRLLSIIESQQRTIENLTKK